MQLWNSSCGSRPVHGPFHERGAKCNADAAHVGLFQVHRRRQADDTLEQQVRVGARLDTRALEDGHVMQWKEARSDLDVRIICHQLHSYLLGAHAVWQQHGVDPPDWLVAVPACLELYVRQTTHVLLVPTTDGPLALHDNGEHFRSGAPDGTQHLWKTKVLPYSFVFVDTPQPASATRRAGAPPASTSHEIVVVAHNRTALANPNHFLGTHRDDAECSKRTYRHLRLPRTIEHGRTVGLASVLQEPYASLSTQSSNLSKITNGNPVAMRNTDADHVRRQIGTHRIRGTPVRFQLAINWYGRASSVHNRIRSCRTSERGHENMVRWVRHTQSLDRSIQRRSAALHCASRGASTDSRKMTFKFFDEGTLNANPAGGESAAAVSLGIGANERLVHAKLLPRASNNSTRNCHGVGLIHLFARNMNVIVTDLHYTATCI
mmetsp:Transcript_2573/g.7671  ORF Transcript_2573/g.7671 Transcript_2573/m.7671 type:complete len:434 (+) Transcript_2573:507-1808(+)